jgi:hypothetical protein
MESPTTSEILGIVERKNWYRSLPLIELVRRIVELNDRQALEEFHNNRCLFNYGEKRHLCFMNYLKELKNNVVESKRLRTNSLEVATNAFDLTVDKFINFPTRPHTPEFSNSNNTKKVDTGGPDCRLYFKAFLKFVKKSFTNKPAFSKLEAEARTAKIIQGFVRRHFFFSLHEAMRSANPFWSRYNWKIEKKYICVWLPKRLSGSERRKWLKKNIGDVKPGRTGEKQRIQAIINQKLIKERFVPLDDIEANPSKIDLDFSDFPHTNFKIKLAKAVAEEKARNLDKQRRSIKALGKSKLKKMIKQIFEDISFQEYNDSKVARDYGLTKSTFSRFAGSRWNQKDSPIPDLWRNTAHLLANNQEFKKIAVKAGIWDKVRNTTHKTRITK